MAKTTIGWRERVELLDFDKSVIKAKMDTGARTSSLHATHISESDDSGKKYITFRAAASACNTKIVLHSEPLLLNVIPKWHYIQNHCF